MIKMFIAVHGRHRVLDIFARNACFPVIAVASTDEDIKICKSYGWEVTQYPNDNLSSKLQAGLQYAKNLEWDNLIMVGSDDIMCDRLADLYRLYANKVPFAALRQCWIYDLNTKYLRLWMGYTNERKGEPAGAGRMFSRELLEQLDFNIWGGAHKNGVDAKSWARVKESGCHIELIDIRKNYMFVDLKDKDSTTKSSLFNGQPSASLNRLHKALPDSKNW